MVPDGDVLPNDRPPQPARGQRCARSQRDERNGSFCMQPNLRHSIGAVAVLRGHATTHCAIPRTVELHAHIQLNGRFAQHRSAQDEGRTRKTVRSGDFESPASASSATRAHAQTSASHSSKCSRDHRNPPPVTPVPASISLAAHPLRLRGRQFEASTSAQWPLNTESGRRTIALATQPPTLHVLQVLTQLIL